VRRKRTRTLRIVDHLPWLVPLLAFAAIVVALRLSPVRNQRAGQTSAVSDAEGAGTSRPTQPESSGWRHRVVDAPDDMAEGWTEHVSLADAVAAAADGDQIELAFSAVRDEAPIVVEGKRLTIRAAEGFRPEVRFSGFATESMARERAGVVLDGADVTVHDVTLLLAGSSESVDPAARLLLLRGGARLMLEQCRISLESGGAALVDSRRPRCIEVIASPSSQETAEAGEAGSSRVELSQAIVRGDMTFLEVSGEGRVDVSWSGGSLATDGRCLVVEGASRDAGEGTLVTLSLRQGLFACREGFACLLDSPARPTEPRLHATATGCRFLTPDGVPLIEQSGIEDPEVYRGRVRWVDSGSRYEGSPTFRRIDGAAERVEIDFVSLPQPMQFLPQFEAWPSDALQ